MLKGIDVSEHQGIINWDKLKGKIDYAILRVGYGSDILSQDDKYFKRNADECTRLKIPFGVYLYSYATTVSQAESEAKHVLRLIKGYKLDYPVYYDLEDENTTGKQSNTTIAQIAQTFCKSLESNGYFVGVYANTYWFNTKLTDKIFNNYVRWVAEYNKSCNYKGKYHMWQYTSTGRLDGIAGNVDMNYCYEEYSQVIKSKSLNGYEKPIEKSKLLSLTLGGEKKVGKALEIIADANPKGQTLYKFWMKDKDTQKTVLLKDYGTENKFNYNILKPGNYNFIVHVKHIKSGNQYDDFKGIDISIRDVCPTCGREI